MHSVSYQHYVFYIFKSQKNQRCYYLKLLISHKVKVEPYHDDRSFPIIPSAQSFLFGKFKADLKIPVMKGQA